MHEISSCLYVGRYESEPHDQPDEVDDFPTDVSRIRRNLINPALADYPELSNSYIGVTEHRRSRSYIKELNAPGLIIADLSCLTGDELKIVTERQMLGRPTILLLPSNSFLPPIDISQCRWITYAPENPGISRNT